MSPLRPLLPVMLPALLTVLLVAPAPPSAHASGRDGAEGIETARTARQIAPGVRLESYDRLEADRWLRIDELDVRLAGAGAAGAGGAGADSGVRAEYLGGRGLAALADSAARHPAGPGRRVVAAVNGDFFDIRGTGAPLGPGIGAGRLLHTASSGAGQAVGFDADGLGRVLRLALDGSVTLPGGAVRPLAGFNTARPPAEGFAAYTADWPAAGLPVSGPAVELRDGRVAAVRAAVRRPARRDRPAPGTTLLIAAGTAAPELAALRPGDAVAVAARPVAAGGGPLPVSAVGGREALVVAGVPQDHDGEPNNAAAPRTAVGFSRDGRRARLVTVDGRQPDSGGMTLTALGRLMHRLGAHEALNLDGGGSSTLLAALTGEAALTVENSPSDGRQRPVPNGLVLTAPSGTGRATGYRIEPVGGAPRAFPGLTRTLRATPYDALLGPVPAPETAPSWSLPGGGGRIDSAGGLRAAAPGPVEARAQGGTARGALRVEVLGAVTRVRAVPDRIGLAEEGERARFVLTGHDAQGAAAVIEPRDVALDYDRSRWSVADDGSGGFTVTARVPGAAGRVRATVRGSTVAAAEVALGVGLSDRPLADMEDAARWTGTGAAPGEGRPGRGLALTPPAGGGTATAAPPRPLRVPDLARSLRLWVNGDASGTRPAVDLTDAEGTTATLRGPAVDWTGWRRIDLPLPPQADPPFTVTRLTATTPSPTRTKHHTTPPPKPHIQAAAPGPAGSGVGRVLVDGLVARTPPTGVVRTGDGRDPVVATEGRVNSRPWRFAVEAAGARPASAAGAGRTAAVDFALTGAGRPAFVHRGVRFLPLGSTRPTLAGGGLERITALRAALATAAREPGTGALAVVEPYAPQAVDRKEAALRLRLLAEFRRATGKRVLVLTVGAPRFAAGRTEGVLTVAAPRAGRTVIGADAFAAGDWLSVLPAGPVRPAGGR
ncbi:phosphodiester glycosidase family protein [Streptomyces sp. NPDC051563]|uniref:phosphodiester glycosidase family protein n=1 Tax=Streptomyces sp. NPDC051563 TaxID=3365659 RepID=UPI00378CD046